ncbi:hypothetical protein LZ32DRAFT_183299 [Colletotrichum eremochloae]|nr:hypothetical protein LZ32DRAFT_183299 [Colletotrichum eremochloae]
MKSMWQDASVAASKHQVALECFAFSFSFSFLFYFFYVCVSISHKLGELQPNSATSPLKRKKNSTLQRGCHDNMSSLLSDCLIIVSKILPRRLV